MRRERRSLFKSIKFNLILKQETKKGERREERVRERTSEVRRERREAVGPTASGYV